jgi:RNA polymerase sigma-70 factor (ECF subfamily)
VRTANARGLVLGSSEASTRSGVGVPTFDEVFDAQGPYVARTLRCLGVREHELDDACQEVFVVVHRRLSELASPAALRAWLYGICLRKALAQRRAAARRREDGIHEDTRRVDADQEESVERRERLTRALAILDALSDEKRAVFVLYEVEQLTMSEVADVVGCPAQTAYARLYAARREVEASLKRLRAGGRIE